MSEAPFGVAVVYYIRRARVHARCRHQWTTIRCDKDNAEFYAWQLRTAGCPRCTPSPASPAQPNAETEEKSDE